MTRKQIKKLSDIQLQVAERDARNEIQCRMDCGISDYGTLGNTFAMIHQEMAARKVETLG